MSGYPPTILPVSEMSISELEAELAILKMTYVMIAAAVDVVSSQKTTMGEILDNLAVNRTREAYRNRIHDIENEIFERKVLIQS